MSTGLACGSQIANVFLEALDRSYAASFSADTALYLRYIDDILIIGRACLADILACINGFDVGIKITHDSSETGRSTSFLDLRITITDSSMLYETFRKPLCTYDYLPFTSCHSRSCKLGIFKVELIRLLRTNKVQQRFEKEADFTFRKLLDRGYDRAALREIRASIPWSSKQERSRNSARTTCNRKKPRVLPFKIRFSDAAHKIGIGQILASHARWLPKEFSDMHRILVCHVSNKNLFRLRYHRFL